MALAASNLHASIDGTNTTSYNFAVSDPGTDCWLIVDVVGREAAGSPTTPTLSGGGLSYSEEINVESASVRQLTRFYAAIGGSGPGAFTLNVDYGAEGQTACGCHVTKVTGGDAGDILVDGNSKTASGNGTTASVTMDAFGSADNRPVITVCNFLTNAITEEGGWTALAASGQTENIRQFTAWHASTADTSPSATWTGTGDWFMIASELKAATGAAAASLDPFGTSGFFGA